MSDIKFDHLPDDVWVCILQHCEAQDLAILSSVSKRYYRLVNDELLWKYILYRDFKVPEPDLGVVDSYKKLYTNLFNKYGCMLGLYQSQIGPYGGLMEIRYNAGTIEGIQWEPSSMDDVMSPLKESVIFTISSDSVPPQCLCIPRIYPHPCTFKVDKRTGSVTQDCSSPAGHIKALREQHDDDEDALEPKGHQLIFLNDIISNGLEYIPLILPALGDIPAGLKGKDGSFPDQIFSPGLFIGTYSLHGLEIILFRYKDENEIHGYKVTGDTNVFANKITVKVNLRFPVNISKRDQKSITAMKGYEPAMSDVPVSQIAEQPFVLPWDCLSDTNTPIPTKCQARYHGFGQLADTWFQRPRFSRIHVVVFNNDLIGVLWLEIESFSLYYRVKKEFTSSFLTGHKRDLILQKSL